VSFLPFRDGAGGDAEADFDVDEDLTSEHRRLQRTPTPYYEDPPSLLISDTLISRASQQIGGEVRSRNYPFCVEWNVS